jgi:uncharacterized protein (DUF433 family)
VHVRTTLLALAFGLATVSPALAQDLSIPWSSIDAGGGTLNAGPYTLSGTIGQLDAHAPLQAGPYTLTGGFWPGVSTNPGCSSADLAEPFGSLNFFDIAAYIALFNANDPAADFAAPFGTLNFFDISAFIGAYNAGCP